MNLNTYNLQAWTHIKCFGLIDLKAYELELNSKSLDWTALRFASLSSVKGLEVDRPKAYDHKLN